MKLGEIMENIREMIDWSKSIYWSDMVWLLGIQTIGRYEIYHSRIIGKLKNLNNSNYWKLLFSKMEHMIMFKIDKEFLFLLVSNKWQQKELKSKIDTVWRKSDIALVENLARYQNSASCELRPQFYHTSSWSHKRCFLSNRSLVSRHSGILAFWQPNQYNQSNQFTYASFVSMKWQHFGMWPIP